MIMKLLKVVTGGFCTLALHRKPPMSLLFTVKAPHSHRLLKSTFPPPCSSLTHRKLTHASLSSILPCFSRPRPLCITVSSPYNPKEIKQSTLNWLCTQQTLGIPFFPQKSPWKQLYLVELYEVTGPRASGSCSWRAVFHFILHLHLSS